MTRMCSIRGCNRKHLAKGLCNRCYYRSPKWKEYQKVYRQQHDRTAYFQSPERKKYEKEYYQKHKEKFRIKRRERYLKARSTPTE